MTENSTGFWVVTRCSSERVQCFEEQVVSIFRFEEKPNRKLAEAGGKLVSCLPYSLAQKMEIICPAKYLSANYMALRPTRPYSSGTPALSP